MIITGNKNFGLAQALSTLYPHALFCSRTTGFDLCSKEGQESFAIESTQHDIIIINSALYQFNQTVLLDMVYQTCYNHEVHPHIIAIGSTTDRVKKGGAWLYNAEKKALRDYCNTLALMGVWGENNPRVSLISFGTLTNNQHKHPQRKCMDIDMAARYVKWIIDQPIELHVNELSIDPNQR